MQPICHVREMNLPQMRFSGRTTRGSARASPFVGPVAPTRGRHLASRREATVCLEQMYAKSRRYGSCRKGCAPHTNEGIDRFPRRAVVSRSLKWCTNLQLEQGWLIPVDLFIYLTNIPKKARKKTTEWATMATFIVEAQQHEHVLHSENGPTTISYRR